MRLIRILVVILFVGGITYLFSNYLFQKNQSDTYKNLLADLNLLYDLSIKQEPINKNCKKVMGYMFESKQSDNYKLVEWCSNGYFTFKSIDLNKYIVTINPLFPATTFKISGSTTNLSDDNSIKLKHRFLGKDYEVTIAIDGYIK